ncbi:hypothetical protein PSD17_05570 [Pseudonocardia sp. D17]|nr:hypothetical protein PSD17_05570 [Pseudonocardia sp. D17]
MIRAVTFVDGDARSTPTPTGMFKVEWEAENSTSREYNSPMPYSVFFAPGGIGVHEGGQRTPSAGCVKLGRADAHALFAELQVGDEVQVTCGTRRRRSEPSPRLRGSDS